MTINYAARLFDLDGLIPVFNHSGLECDVAETIEACAQNLVGVFRRCPRWLDFPP